MSDFSGEGYQPFPSLFYDYMQVGDYANDRIWTDKNLIDKLQEYTLFSERDDLMPRARETARLMLLHLVFELTERGAQELKGETVE